MKIDIVIPWVDGNDPEWQAVKSEYNPDEGTDTRVNRYRDWGILKYWFRGIEKFAPWVNKIHFITWGHVPEWLNVDQEKLNIVRHEAYIDKAYLPTFSSHPIELNMHRIKDLSEQFIYFNDDMFVIRPVKPEDFFRDGLPVDTVTEVPLRFNPGGVDHIIGNDMMIINKHFPKEQVTKLHKKKWFSLKAMKSTMKNLYMKPVKGFSGFDNPHVPQAFLKSTFDQVWDKERGLMEQTSSHRFRSNEDVNQWLMRYWQFVTGQFVQVGDISGRFFSIGRDDESIADAIVKQQYNTICLSDDDTRLDFDSEQKLLIELFETILPEKSSFEK